MNFFLYNGTYGEYSDDDYFLDSDYFFDNMDVFKQKYDNRMDTGGGFGRIFPCLQRFSV